MTIAGKPEAGKTPAVSPSAELKALLGQWKVVRVEKGKDADSSWGTISGRHRLSTRQVRIGSSFPSPFEEGQVRFRRFRPQKSPPAERPAAGSLLRADPRGVDSARLVRRKKQIRSGRIGGTLLHVPHRPDRGSQNIRFARFRPRFCRRNGKRRSLGGGHLPDRRRQVEDPLANICLASRATSGRRIANRPLGYILFVLKRFRPSQDDKAIEGDWTVVSHTENGKPIEDDGASYSFHNDSIGDGFGAKGPYDLDATKQPRQITICWGSNATGSFKSEGQFLASTGSMATA